MAIQGPVLESVERQQGADIIYIFPKMRKT